MPAAPSAGPARSSSAWPRRGAVTGSAPATSSERRVPVKRGIDMSGFRLSPQQERLWVLSGDDEVPYHGWCALSLRGTLDREALRGACRALVERYEVLRTTFQKVAGLRLPLQVIGAPELAESEEDLSGRPDGERAARLAELLAPGGCRRFDFAQGPLVGCHLVCLE